MLKSSSFLKYHDSFFFRNVPIALIVTLILAALIYVSMNIAFFAVLDEETFRNSEAVAVVSENFEKFS